MMSEDTRKLLIQVALHEKEHVRARYKLGLESLETLKAVARALESLMNQIQIEAGKE